MKVCNRCGTVVEDCEVGTYSQCHGYTSLGDGLCETVVERCRCGGDYVEATKCELCGEWFDDTDLNGVCECCLDEHETVDNAIDYGAEHTATIDGINGAVTYLLTTEEINEILIRWIKENFTDTSYGISEFICSEQFDFSEWLKEKKKERD